jgi:hypothetical protein
VLSNLHRSSILIGTLGIIVMAFCGSWIGNRIGLHGLDQWPIIGFAVGLLICSQAPLFELRDRLSKLENRITDIQNSLDAR